MAEQQSATRTMWHWLSWVGGLFFLFLAVAALVDSRVIATLAALGVVALLLPPVRAWTYAKSGAHLPGLGRAVLIFLLSFVFMIFVPPPDETARQPQEQAVESATPQQYDRPVPAPHLQQQAVDEAAAQTSEPEPAREQPALSISAGEYRETTLSLFHELLSMVEDGILNPRGFDLGFSPGNPRARQWLQNVEELRDKGGTFRDGLSFGEQCFKLSEKAGDFVCGFELISFVTIIVGEEWEEYQKLIAKFTAAAALEERAEPAVAADFPRQ